MELKGDRKAMAAAKTATETLLTPLIVAAPMTGESLTPMVGRILSLIW